MGRTETQYLSQIIGTPKAGASPILARWEWQSPLNRAASKCRLYQSSRCLPECPLDIPGHTDPFLPLSPFTSP